MFSPILSAKPQAVGNVFGESQPEFKEIFQKREKKMKKCKVCDIELPYKFLRCPICDGKLEEK